MWYGYPCLESTIRANINPLTTFFASNAPQTTHKFSSLSQVTPSTSCISTNIINLSPNPNKINISPIPQDLPWVFSHKAFMLTTCFLSSISGTGVTMLWPSATRSGDLNSIFDVYVTSINIPYPPGWNLMDRRPRKGRDPRRKLLSPPHDCHPWQSERRRQSHLWLHITRRCHFWKSRPSSQCI